MASEGTRLFGVERADLPLACAGCALAVGLSVAAGAMVLRADKRPLVNGADHLALFARPAQLHEERLRAQTPPPVGAEGAPARVGLPAATPTAAAPIDYAPTATILPQQLPTRVASSRASTEAAYTLVKASRGRATFRGPGGDVTVKQGGIVPGLGRVTAITLKDRAWRVVLSGANPTRR